MSIVSHNFQASHLRARCTARFRTVGDWTSIGNFQAKLTLTFMKRWLSWNAGGKMTTYNFVVAQRLVLFIFPSLSPFSAIPSSFSYLLPSYLNSFLSFSFPPSFLHYLCFSLSSSSPSPLEYRGREATRPPLERWSLACLLPSSVTACAMFPRRQNRNSYWIAS